MRILQVIFFFLSFSACLAQAPDGSAPVLSHGQDSMVTAYYSVRDSLLLYNGRQFYGYPTSIEGHAFYGTGDVGSGSVLYNNVWYHHVLLYYDIYKDELIVRHPPPFEVNVIVFGANVSRFIVNGQTFIYLNRDKDNVLTDGLYQELATGNVTLLAKRKKLLEEKINGLQLEARFIAKDNFFLVRDGVYHPIRKEAELMSLLNDKREELYQFKRANALKFRANPEQFILAITNYYNQLHQ